MSTPIVIGIDAGNTAIKWQLNTESAVQRCDSVDTLIRELQALLLPVARVVVCSVRGAEFDQHLASALTAALQVPVEFYYSEPQYGAVANAYGAQYTQLGADRWMVILAMAARYQQGLSAVVDIGTAVTLDFIDTNKGHLGGYIVPGYATLVEAINTKARLIDIQPMAVIPEQALGANTQQCVSLGGAYMVAAMINQTLARFKVDHICYTGGGYDLIKKQLLMVGEYAENLVFEGLFWRSMQKN